MRNRQRPVSVEEEAGLHETARRGVIAEQLADFTRQELLGSRERQIRTKIFDIIDSPEPLDPYLAVQSWIELRAAYELVSRLEKLRKAGSAASSTLSQRGTQTQ
jgi:hypothetical protein